MAAKVTNAQAAVLGILLHGFPVTAVPWSEDPPVDWKMVCEYVPHPRISTLRALHSFGLVEFTEDGYERNYYLTARGAEEARKLEAE
jgi:hypothetical protein